MAREFVITVESVTTFDVRVVVDDNADGQDAVDAVRWDDLPSQDQWRPEGFTVRNVEAVE